jgi:hypothetical protein
VFTLPDRGPDIEGVLVDASGSPVPFGHIDHSRSTAESLSRANGRLG